MNENNKDKRKTRNHSLSKLNASRTIDLSGQRFGSVIATSLKGRINNRTWFNCLCDCGEVFVGLSETLRSGQTKRCKKCNLAHLRKIRTTHGESGARATKLYVTWLSMGWRCRNKNRKDYKSYGGRGISICKEWDDYERFKSWANNNGYKQGLSLDRIDNDGNYTPHNCRWATSRQQANNRRNNRFITHDGKTMTLSEWGRYTGFGSDTIQKRLDELGWSVDKALTQKKRVMVSTQRPDKNMHVRAHVRSVQVVDTGQGSLFT